MPCFHFTARLQFRQLRRRCLDTDFRLTIASRSRANARSLQPGKLKPVRSEAALATVRDSARRSTGTLSASRPAFRTSVTSWRACPAPTRRPMAASRWPRSTANRQDASPFAAWMRTRRGQAPLCARGVSWSRSGPRIAEWLMAEARAAGYCEIVGDTMPEMREALALYDRFGFERGDVAAVQPPVSQPKAQSSFASSFSGLRSSRLQPARRGTVMG